MKNNNSMKKSFKPKPKPKPKQFLKTTIIMFGIFMTIYIYIKIFGNVSSIGYLILVIMITPITIWLFIVFYKWILEFKKPYQDRYWRNIKKGELDEHNSKEV